MNIEAGKRHLEAAEGSNPAHGQSRSTSLGGAAKQKGPAKGGTRPNPGQDQERQ